MAVHAGSLRTRVTIQQPIEAVNAVGEQIITWSSVVERFGRLRMLKGREFEGSAVLSETTWELQVRYETAISGMTTKWRVISDGNTYDIKSIDNPYGRNREIVMQLTEVE